MNQAADEDYTAAACCSTGTDDENQWCISGVEPPVTPQSLTVSHTQIIQNDSTV